MERHDGSESEGDQGVNASEILVTGATGSLGRRVVNRLRGLDKGFERSSGAHAMPAWSATPVSTIVFEQYAGGRLCVR